MSGTNLRYERTDDLVRFTLTNHELREVLVGFWARLSAADRADHIRALQAYQTDPASWLSPVAAAIAKGELKDDAIDLRALIARGEKVRP